MNNLEYLNQISKGSAKKSKARKGGDLGLIFKILGGGLVAFVILLIIGLIVGNGSTSNPVDLTRQLYLRTDNLNATVKEYNQYLKSSNLRAIGISLNTTLTEAGTQLKSYLTEKGKDTEVTENAENEENGDSLATDETAHINEVNSTLANAKLNGILDRIYANEIQLQVSLLLSLISQNLAATSPDDASLTNILNTYQSNLSVIEKNLNEYSNPSD